MAGKFEVIPVLKDMAVTSDEDLLAIRKMSDVSLFFILFQNFRRALFQGSPRFRVKINASL